MANVINIGGGANGGGTSVVPNPQGTATDTLTKLGIEGTIYDFASGGGGSSYSETTLWSGEETPSTSGTQITLSDSISNYDEVAFVTDTDYVGVCKFLVSELTIGELYIATIYAPNNYGVCFSYDSATTVTIKRLASAHPVKYVKVVGIKYGDGSSGHNYSTTEQVVGTWIDGSDLYEKTVLVQNVTLADSTTTNITINDYISNFGFPISLEAFCKDQSNYYTLPYYAGGQYVIEAFFNGGSIISVYRNGGAITVDMYLTIRYTKSAT